ncbi:MAG TPA: Hsp20/alpha crystallin family protein [Stellaceae bacterium]|nr:Hsp20/alpha crystallin family protein [Stellaceae bacterium]
MAVRDLISWGRGRAPAAQQPDPLAALHREMNRLFDDFWRDFEGLAGGFGFDGQTVWPQVEVAESDAAVTVTAELPGLDQKDVEVLLNDGVLTLRGEKKSEIEDKNRHFSERRYGRFERRIPLDVEIDQDKVNAAFKNGVLTINLPKAPQAVAQSKRIAITSG